MMAAATPYDSTTYSQPKDSSMGKGEPSPAAKRHAEFYFTDEMTVFQVENRLFRVHRYFLTENSLIFSSMFSLPQGDQQVSSTAAEGTSDANPIYLSGVTELEFETLLRFFFKGFTLLSQKSLITLLSIAHRYEFLNVRERAILEIYGPFRARQQSWDSMVMKMGLLVEPEEEIQEDYQMLISLAEKYDVPLCHVVPLLVPFVVRKQPLTVKEVSGFSALTVTRVAHAREALLRERKSLPGCTRPAAEEVVFRIWQVQNDE